MIRFRIGLVSLIAVCAAFVGIQPPAIAVDYSGVPATDDSYGSTPGQTDADVDGKASLGVQRYCQTHNTLMGSTKKETINVKIYDPLTGPNEKPFNIGMTFGYEICRRGAKPDFVSANYQVLCATQVSSTRSLVFKGLRIEGFVRNDRYGLDHVGTQTDPDYPWRLTWPRDAVGGESHCTKEFYSSDDFFTKRSLNMRWAVNYWETTDGWPDQKHETGYKVIDPANDQIIDPFP